MVLSRMVLSCRVSERIDAYELVEQDGQNLIWRGAGETLMLTPWGKDSLRVRSVLMGEIADNRFALLDPPTAAACDVL